MSRLFGEMDPSSLVDDLFQGGNGWMSHELPPSVLYLSSEDRRIVSQDEAQHMRRQGAHASQFRFADGGHAADRGLRGDVSMARHRLESDNAWLDEELHSASRSWALPSTTFPA